MLEVFIVWKMCQKVGAIVSDKGRSPIGYQVMTAALWIFGEIMGAVVGYVVQGNDRLSLQVYTFPIIGAAIGAGISFIVAASVPPVRRKKRRKRRRRRCSSCGEPLRQPGPCPMCGEPQRQRPRPRPRDDF